MYFKIIFSLHWESDGENAFFFLQYLFLSTYIYVFSRLIWCVMIWCPMIIRGEHRGILHVKMVKLDKSEYLFSLKSSVHPRYSCLLLNLDYSFNLHPLYCFGFHFKCLNVGISYLEKEEVRVLLRQVIFKHLIIVVERPFSVAMF